MGWVNQTLIQYNVYVSGPRILGHPMPMVRSGSPARDSLIKVNVFIKDSLLQSHSPRKQLHKEDFLLQEDLLVKEALVGLVEEEDKHDKLKENLWKTKVLFSLKVLFPQKNN